MKIVRFCNNKNKEKNNMIYNDVAITRCSSKKETEAVIEGLELIKASLLIDIDDTVVIVPNLVNDKRPHPKYGVIIGSDTLKAIIEWVKELHPKRIVIACGSGGGNTMDVIKSIHYDEVIEDEKVEFIDLNSGPYTEIKLDHNKPNIIKINKIYSEMTKLISFTQLKVHEEATMSASIKNVAMSFPTTEEHGTPKKDKGIHDDLHGFIKAMAEKIKIDISIVSLNPVMVGTGPTKGIAKHTGLVIVGNNPFGVDTICARMLGYKPQAIRYLYELENNVYKETNIKNINVLGIKLRDAEEIFNNEVYGQKTSVD
jgi:uncharacterized protein (DUF362 family)